MPTFEWQLVRDQIDAVLRAWGMTGARAQATAGIMVDADLSGIDSHGISMLPAYGRLVEAGHLDLTAVAEVVDETDSAAVIDGRHALGHLTTASAMRLAIEKSAKSGIGAVAVRRSRHFGAAGHYAALAASAGVIGLVTSTTRTMAVAPTRGSRPVLGTNPLAFAAPSADPAAPFILDMSTSTVAVNKVKVHSYTGNPLPAGWMTGADGMDVTDAQIGYRQLREETDTSLTPLGSREETSSHKGYGLAVMVQILAGALTGTAFLPDRETAARERVGHFCLAIDPGGFGDRRAFVESVSVILDTLRDEPPVDDSRPVIVAGDREREIRARRTAEGIPLSAELLDELAATCARAGTPLLLSRG